MNLRKLLNIDVDDEVKDSTVNENPVIEKIKEFVKVGGYILYIGKLVKGENGKDDKIDHYVSIGDGFKFDDIPLCCDQFRKDAGNIVKRQKDIQKDVENSIKDYGKQLDKVVKVDGGDRMMSVINGFNLSGMAKYVSDEEKAMRSELYTEEDDLSKTFTDFGSEHN